MTDDRPGTALALVLVCTANVCRSPLAERVLAARLAGQGWLGAVPVLSAGVRAAVGQPMCAVSATLLEPGDPTPDGHVARQATRETVEAAGLVLVMEREQRGEIARLAPGAQSKVFTLREALSLAEQAALRIDEGTPQPQDLADLARLLHSVRGFGAPPAPAEPKRRTWWRRPEEPADPLTIVDGHGGPEPAHLAAVTEVRATASRVADAFVSLAAAGRSG